MTKKKESARHPGGLKATKQDDQVMAVSTFPPTYSSIRPQGPTTSTKHKCQTNNSSIVSKRSVERLYYADESHFFRFFVKKFQRRAPLINRGYWLRLHVIDVLVREFLKRPSEKSTKVVVNLGCGYDVLPWQCLTRYPEHCQDAMFVDVDFPDLMLRKRRTVLDTPELSQAFEGLQVLDEGSPVLLHSRQYAQIGCDLRRIDELQKALHGLVDASQCSFLFVAEVSITYMDTEAADKVIEWAGSMRDAQFVLLEQILPDGPTHPFAKTMLDHFDKLNTPPKSVLCYPELRDQTRRFASWKTVRPWTLWDAWSDDAILSPQDRRKLDAVEPFDEWEEFVLFASHYCVIHATTKGSEPVERWVDDASCDDLERCDVDARVVECMGHSKQRRFGAAMLLRGTMGDPIIVNALGLGNNNRLQSCHVFREKGSPDQLVLQPGGPSGRMAYTLTDLGPRGFLLAGGRTSPSNPLKDCWVFSEASRTWFRTHELPFPLFRHAVTRLGRSSLALLVGGKCGLSTSRDWLFYQPDRGWKRCRVDESQERTPSAVSGPIFACTGTGMLQGTWSFTGILAGGLLEDGTISDQLWQWDLVLQGGEAAAPIITFHDMTDPSHASHVSRTARRLLSRYGATCLTDSDDIIVMGGVSKRGIFGHHDEVLRARISTNKLSIKRLVVPAHLRPVWVGVSAVRLEDEIFVLGGGATCFSMGTFWNKALYRFGLQRDCLRGDWELSQTVEMVPASMHDDPSHGSAGKKQFSAIKRIKPNTAEDFVQVMKSSQPAVLEGLSLGACVSSWTLEHLEQKVGRDANVTVHESSSPHMDFNSKNFGYLTMGFGELLNRVRRGDMVYLRALSADAPVDKPAVLGEDFPGIAADFTVPEQLSFVSENLFSSVLRISGPVNIWLHYDVMANVYCQIGGSKRMLLFPPSDVQYFSVAPGASSSSFDVFSLEDSAVLARTHGREVILSPGEVLYIPPLWLHTAQPRSGWSVAVNVFFRDLASEYYATGRDVYGNRDLAAYEKGRRDVSKIAKAFQGLPQQAREFYLARLADELRSSV